MSIKKLLHIFGLCCLSFALLCPVSAKAPATEKILFTSNRDGNWEIFSMNPDGSQQVRLTHHRAADLRPVWSPTGEQILFMSDRGGPRDLYLMDTDGQRVRPLFKIEKAYRSGGTWSPDGRRIAYAQSDLGTDVTTLYTAKTDGTLVKRVLQVNSVESGQPTWAPEGTEIAFVVAEEIHWASRQIRFIDLKTRKQQTLLPDDEPRMYQPAWSPDGTKIAFVWHRTAAQQQSIFIVNRDGSGLEQLVDVFANAPVWSPTGDELLYSQAVPKEGSQIFKIDLGTRSVTQLTRRGNNFPKSWFDPRRLPVSPQPQLLTTTWSKMKL